MSMTTTTPSGPPFPCAVVSIAAGIMRGGRLSMQKYPASSKACRALDLPAPERPVMMTMRRLPATGEPAARGVLSLTPRRPTSRAAYRPSRNRSLTLLFLACNAISTLPCGQRVSQLSMQSRVELAGDLSREAGHGLQFLERGAEERLGGAEVVQDPLLSCRPHARKLVEDGGGHRLSSQLAMI